jgi:hypothetical protein
MMWWGVGDDCPSRNPGACPKISSNSSSAAFILRHLRMRLDTVVAALYLKLGTAIHISGGSGRCRIDTLLVVRSFDLIHDHLHFPDLARGRERERNEMLRLVSVYKSEPEETDRR